MARPLRIEYPGAVYHAMARGHERSSMFRDDTDRHKFLSLLALVVGDERWQMHAYCLMSNHYHLLLETPDGRLSRGMKTLNGRYAQWFNWRHSRRGHFLESRFRSVLVQKGGHLLELMRYIVLNPVRAGLVERCADWPWSSYRATAGTTQAPSWLQVDWTLSQFARQRARARQAFRRFVAEAKGSVRGIEAAERSGYFGDEDFREQVQELIDAREISAEIPRRYQQARPPIGIEEVKAAVAREWGVRVGALVSRGRGEERKAAIYLTKKASGLGGREIGAMFGVKAAQVSHVMREIDDNPESPLSRRVHRVRSRLNI